MTDFGKDLIAAMGEALAHVEGAKNGVKEHQVDLGAIDARAIRKALNLTQEEMALVLGTSTSGYRKWEQGERQPSGAARMLLKIMEKEPEAVLRVVKAA